MWVYGVTEEPAQRIPAERGLEDARLEGVEAGGLLAVVSWHEDPPREPSHEALWAHERVVESLMAEGPVLPMRFGTALPDADAVRSAVAARREELAAALDLVRGRVELGVRVQATGDEEDRARPVTGREYLLARIAADDRATAVHRPLDAHAVASRRRATSEAGEVLRAAYLVDAETVPAFRAEVERMQAEHGGLAVLCTGPWPPYSFVTAGAP